MLTGILVAVAAGAVALAIVVVRRSGARTTALRRRLDGALQDLEALQRSFGRFAPAEIVEDIVARGVSTRPETKTITVLFADLQGFTRLAGELPPDVLVRVLNGWFERMSDALEAHHGHLAKFLGDGLLALFGALEANPWHTDDAVHAALAMRAALAAYDEELRADGLPALQLGIGIHRGEVVAGVLGTRALVEYGVVGATVNLASRVEGLTRLHGVDVLVTAAVVDALDARFAVRPMPAAEVKGVARPLATWAVDGFAAS